MDWDNDKIRELMESKSEEFLQKNGGVEGVAKLIGSDIKDGIAASTIEDRKTKYGENKIERREPATLIQLFLDAMKDVVIMILIGAAVVSIVLGSIMCSVHLGAQCPKRLLWEHGAKEFPESELEEELCVEWLDGVAIICAVLIVGGVTAVNNYKSEQQFRILQAKQDDALVVVQRDGSVDQINVNAVVVGDVVSLGTGAKIPADGLLIKFSDLKVDESSLTGESDAIRKDDERPFMFSGCTVTEGDGVFIVTAVGKHSEWGKILTELDTEREDTPLQVKLATLAQNIGIMGTVVAGACFISQTIIWLVEMSYKTCFTPNGDGDISSEEDCVLGHPGLMDQEGCEAAGYFWKTHYQNFSALRLQHVVEFFIDFVTIIVVAVPEGLPLAVTISLAYSVQKMQKDQNLVRIMAACETMGGATNICSDKTGTLTENLMTVTEGYFQGQAYSNSLPSMSSIEKGYYTMLAEAMAINSKADLGKVVAGRTEIIGNKTEGAMLLFLKELGGDYKEIRNSTQIVRSYPFSSAKKRMSTLIRTSVAGRLYTKGASEIILELCTSYIASDGIVKPIGEAERQTMSQHIVSMASQGLRTICIAYRDVTDPDAVAKEDDPPEVEMTCIGIVGIKDPLRKEVPAAVESCQKAGIMVRMVTGDNVLTAKSIAKECGILTTGSAVEGPDFRKMTPDEQKSVLKDLQVMARCSPQDKLILVRRLKEMGEVVAVTGDGTNDAPALKEADVGLSMGIAGTAVAQEASDIVIMDDNFSSIVKSVLWGRSVYDNIRRFLQFQLNVNVVALEVSFIGSVCGFGMPLKPVQLLWVNLVMDTLGALALATEQPTADLLDRQPYGRHDNLVNDHMWRNIAVQSTYQIIFCMVMLFQGHNMLNDCTDGNYGSDYSSCIDLNQDGSGKVSHQNYRDTCIYNAFVWAQVFNEFNARKIYNEKNMFAGVMTNHIFLGVIVATCLIQFLTVQFGQMVFQTTPLDLDDWCICILIGAFSLPLGYLQRFLPPLTFINSMIDKYKKKPSQVTPEEETADKETGK
mmetsp:Transcript_58777/g.120242  ORF Transcript_58777/g.120242 Transcript_58777/m.120242 type:complete len:1033 (-) Transcript_58777:399-3497(-)|eukprot:CAMPEP_0181305156 /NCGR_PEP_ID=MMETSP1101-20121128/9564_1 /TAXON_ID=46948 /ORGANISM="Rhodomonas abbreviata, Strain Caron Lab Isolate" /LENGTH=1032 /DNA_ID=CAMNT_0023411023 /DNA_START=187 /DNA_END=3285 /DNA_ORIENTATION=-